MIPVVIGAVVWLSGGAAIWYHVWHQDGIVSANVAVSLYNILTCVALLVVGIFIKVAGQ